MGLTPCLNIFVQHLAGRYTPSRGDYKSRTDIPAFPFSRMVKKAGRLKPNGYPAYPGTLGEHIRKIRMDRQLVQKDVAKLFTVSEETLVHWEMGRYTPRIRHFKPIIAFLGYYPFTHETASLGGQILKYRQTNGLTCRQMGRKVGVNASAIEAWEKGKNKPQASSLEKLNRVLQAGKK